MIEETATVVAVHGDYAEVETERRSSCGGCEARHGCGTSLLAKVFGAKRSRMQAMNAVAAQPGERVVIGLAENALLKISLASYLVPLLGLLVGAMAGEALAAGQTEAYSMLGGLAGLGAGLGWLYRFARRSRGHAAYQAVVLRRLPDYSAAFVRFPK